MKHNDRIKLKYYLGEKDRLEELLLAERVKSSKLEKLNSSLIKQAQNPMHLKDKKDSLLVDRMTKLDDACKVIKGFFRASKFHNKEHVIEELNKALQGLKEAL